MRQLLSTSFYAQNKQRPQLKITIKRRVFRPNLLEPENLTPLLRLNLLKPESPIPLLRLNLLEPESPIPVFRLNLLGYGNRLPFFVEAFY